MTWQQLSQHFLEQLSSVPTGRNDPGAQEAWHSKQREPSSNRPDDHRMQPIVKRPVLALLCVLTIVCLTTPILAEDSKQSRPILDSAPLSIEQLESRLATALRKNRELEEKLARSEQLAISTRLGRMRERMEGDARGLELLKAKMAAKNSASEAAKLRNELQVAGKKIQDLQARLEAADELANQPEGAETTLQEARSKIASLEKAVQTAKAKTAAANLKLQAALSTLDFVGAGDTDDQSEILRLKDNLSSSQRTAEEYKAKLKEAELARKNAVRELRALQAAGEGQNLAGTSPEASEAEEARTALRRAQARIASLQQQADVSKAETIVAKGNLEEAVAKHKTLVAERDRALSEVSMLKQVMRRRDSEGLKTAERKLAQAESSRKAVVEELVKARAAKQAQQQELSKAKAAVQETEQEIAILKEKLAKAEASTAKAIDTQTALRQAEARIANLTKSAEASDAEAATARNRLRAMVSKLDGLTSHKERALSEISELKVSRAAAVRDASQKEAELSKLAASVELARATATEQAARASAVLKAKDDNLREVVDELAKVKNELRVTKERVETSKAEANVLRKTLAERKRQLGELRSTLHTAMTEVRQARSEITQRIDRMIEVATTPQKSQIDDLKNKLAAANAEIERLKVLLREKPPNPEG